MRYINILLTTLMLIFIVVQYNDPDGLMWMLIYLVPAIWAASAVFRPQWLGTWPGVVVLWISIILSVGLTIYYWPRTPGWWRQEIWWEAESAREGMGMMIVTVVMLIVWFGRKRPAHTSD